MLFFYNKKLIIRSDTLAEKKKICLELSKNNIEYQSVTKGISLSKRTGKLFWFNIYVHKKEYEKAKDVLNRMV